jgi:hypothetical protein
MLEKMFDEKNPETDRRFMHQPSTFLRGIIDQYSEGEIQYFCSAWNDLPADSYLVDRGAYRRRRYSAFRIEDGALKLRQTTGFYQSADVNSLFGGIVREFPPVDTRATSLDMLWSIVRGFGVNIPGFDHASFPLIGIHQIRTTTTEGKIGLPAPEGVHRDGHDYVAQILVHRQGITGGESRIYDDDFHMIYKATLTDSLESIVIDDRRVFHDASEILLIPGSSFGVRDMLLIDFVRRPPADLAIAEEADG